MEEWKGREGVELSADTETRPKGFFFPTKRTTESSKLFHSDRSSLELVKTKRKRSHSSFIKFAKLVKVESSLKPGNEISEISLLAEHKNFPQLTSDLIAFRPRQTGSANPSDTKKIKNFLSSSGVVEPWR